MRWIEVGEMPEWKRVPIVKCSACGGEVIGGSKHFIYCPWCGERNKGDE